MEGVNQTVKQFILNEFLPSKDPANLTDSIDLVQVGRFASLQSAC
jgi:hypothetical protein